MVLNHGDVTWDSSKGESSRKQKDFEIHYFERRMKGVVGTCSKKTTNFVLDIPHILFVLLIFISIKHGILLCFLFMFIII